MAASSSPSLTSLSSPEPDPHLADVETRSPIEQSRISTPISAFSALEAPNPQKRPASYIPAENKTKRQRTSAIWSYGKEVERESSSDRRRFWECDICRERFVATSTSNAEKHLRKKHLIRIKSPSLSPPPSSVLEQQRRGAEIQQFQNSHGADNLSFQERLVRFVVCHASFGMVTNPYFRSLFLSTTSKFEISRQLPASHNTLQTWIENDFEKSKTKIKRLLAGSRGNVHISSDLWSSPNGLALNGVVSHFVDAEYNIKTILLGLREIIGQHTGENIGQSMVEIIHDFHLEPKLGTFIHDNATNNDIAVQYIIDTLDLQDTHRKEHCRLRCMGHVINLAAQDFIFGQNSTKWLQEIACLEEASEIDSIQKSWLSRGEIGHLQNLITLIRSSPQRRQAFRALTGADPDKKKQNLMVIRNNATRWNSTYDMLARALQLKDHIQIYVSRARTQRDSRGKLADEAIQKIHQLTEEEWAVLQELCDALQPFHEATNILQGSNIRGSYGYLWECLPVLEWLMGKMEALKDQKGINNKIGLSANNAWNKLTKYYNLTDLSPYYIAAIVLNPVYKWKYFETHWQLHPDWITEARAKMNELWSHHKSSHQNAVEQDQLLPPRIISPVKQPPPPGSFKSFLTLDQTFQESSEIADEYRGYCQLPLLKNKPESLIHWWRDQESLFPVLTTLAYSVLSIPAMSAECERVFSSSKLTVTPNRSKMSPSTLEQCECLRNWFLKEVIC